MENSPIAGFTPPTPDNLSNVLQNDLGKEEFLNLLVAQLQNQDPLSPMEGQEFASQLAQFSSVEQLTSIDGNIEKSINTDLILSQTINNTLATTLIGKQITAVGNQVELKEDSPVNLYFELGGYAQDVSINVMDAAGNIVRTLDTSNLEKGINSIEWDGISKDGESLPEGTYTFEVTATGKTGNDITVQELIRGIADSLQYQGGTALFKIGNLDVLFGDVLEISSGVGA
jgi:flagellar basal-body rod modification protein FlgD